MAEWRARPWTVKLLLAPCAVGLAFAGAFASMAISVALMPSCGSGFFCSPFEIMAFALLVGAPSALAGYTFWRGRPWVRVVVGGGLLFVAGPWLAWTSLDDVLFELNVLDRATGSLLDVVLFGPLAALAVAAGVSILWGGSRAWFDESARA